MKGYRERIYEDYTSVMQREASVFNQGKATTSHKAYATFLKEWLPDDKNARILDIGCGGGGLLSFFKTCGYKNLQGVDRSPQQVALARQVLENVAEIDAFKFLEMHKGEYDLVTGLDIVEHFQKDEALRFLDACHLVLRRGGRLILQTPNAESLWGAKIRYDDFTHEVAFTPHSLSGLLSLAGFSNVKFREAGPVVHGLISLCRFLVWKIIWAVLAFWNLAETGNIGSGIYTRVFLISGVKRDRK